MAALIFAAGSGLDGARAQEFGDSADVQAIGPTAVPDWLDVKDPMSPDRWLASRQAGELLTETDPSVTQARRLLFIAGTRFSESPRMIANRTVQISEMLHADAPDETPMAVLEGLTDVVERNASKTPFGELCQHYYNLRAQGLDRIEALGALRTTYGRS
ncbi:hypothetical protein [Marinivivus vitaminiproducens]|uniref:hypothetical protein n=1 Tax=Marinivivus vitaminiproducens TaxID=3035935 RepID=UPI0027A42D8F|nr:hypothetical protein P4R82_10765 [Geminicoccaceae bacterium SCSIO 64248]